MQLIFVTGNLTADCVSVKSKDGTDFIKFTVAVNGPSKDDKPTYYTCWTRRNGVADILKKGRHVAVSGSLAVTINEKDGKTYTNLDIWVNSLELTPGLKGNGGEDSSIEA